MVLLPMHHEGIAGISVGQPQPFNFFQGLLIIVSWVSFSDILLSIHVEFDGTLIDEEQVCAD